MLERVDIPFADDALFPVKPARGWSITSLWKACAVCAVVIPVFLMGQLVISGGIEGYCIVWPSIGTRFAEGYSHSGFAAIRPGMTRADVVRALGQPLGSSITYRTPRGFDEQRLPGDEVWNYSTDSSARGGDWAWLSREIVFRRGIVHHTHAWVFYD